MTEEAENVVPTTTIDINALTPAQKLALQSQLATALNPHELEQVNKAIEVYNSDAVKETITKLEEVLATLPDGLSKTNIKNTIFGLKAIPTVLNNEKARLTALINSQAQADEEANKIAKANPQANPVPPELAQPE